MPTIQVVDLIMDVTGSLGVNPAAGMRAALLNVPIATASENTRGPYIEYQSSKGRTDVPSPFQPRRSP
mgnify:CR=1 FL=1